MLLKVHMLVLKLELFIDILLILFGFFFLLLFIVEGVTPIYSYFINFKVKKKTSFIIIFLPMFNLNFIIFFIKKKIKQYIYNLKLSLFNIFNNFWNNLKNKIKKIIKNFVIYFLILIISIISFLIVFYYINNIKIYISFISLIKLAFIIFCTIIFLYKKKLINKIKLLKTIQKFYEKNKFKNLYLNLKNKKSTEKNKPSMNLSTLLFLLTGALKNTLDLEHSFKTENSINFQNLKYIKETQNRKRYIRTSAPEDQQHLSITYFKITTFTPTEQIDPNSYQFLGKAINEISSQRDQIYLYLDKNPENVNKEEYTDMAEFMDNMVDNIGEMHRILNLEFTPLYYKCRFYGHKVEQVTKLIRDKNPQFNNTPIDQIQVNYPQKNLYEKATQEYQLELNKLNTNYKEWNDLYIVLTTTNINDLNEIKKMLTKKLKGRWEIEVPNKSFNNFLDHLQNSPLKTNSYSILDSYHFSGINFGSINPTGSGSWSLNPTGSRSWSFNPTGSRSGSITPTGSRSGSITPTGPRSRVKRPIDSNNSMIIDNNENNKMNVDFSMKPMTPTNNNNILTDNSKLKIDINNKQPYLNSNNTKLIQSSNQYFDYMPISSSVQYILSLLILIISFFDLNFYNIFNLSIKDIQNILNSVNFNWLSNNGWTIISEYISENYKTLLLSLIIGIFFNKIIDYIITEYNLYDKWLMLNKIKNWKNKHKIKFLLLYSLLIILLNLIFNLIIN